MTPRKNVIDLGDLEEEFDLGEDLSSAFEDALESVNRPKKPKAPPPSESDESEEQETDISEETDPEQEASEAKADEEEEFFIEIEDEESESIDEDDDEEVEISLAGIMEDALGGDRAKKYKESAGLEVDPNALDSLNDLFEDEDLDEKLSSLPESSKIPASQLRGMPRHKLPAVRKQEMEAKKKEEEANKRIEDLEYALSNVRKEYLSYRGRIETDKKRALDEFHNNLLKQFLPVLDNLERALFNAEKEEGEKDSIVQGLRLILNQFNEILKNRNVVPVEALNLPFDPNVHEAMDVYVNNDVPSNTVLEVFQKGYMIDSKLLRPSLVIVSKRTAPEKTPETEEDRETDDSDIHGSQENSTENMSEADKNE